MGCSTSQTHNFPPGTTAVSVLHRYVNDDPNGIPSRAYPISLRWTDQHGAVVSLRDLAGQWFLLWWYPKASTRG